MTVRTVQTLRVGVIDVGADSAKMLIADVCGGDVAELQRRTAMTSLGEGLDATRVLTQDAIARAEAVVRGFDRACTDQDCERIVTVITSAAREAANRDELVDRLAALGCDPVVLEPGQEARLTFAGASLGDDSGSPIVVIDFGGGSTELVLGRDGHCERSVSTELGVLRMAERHLAAWCDVTGLRVAARASLRAAVSELAPGAVGRVVAVAGVPAWLDVAAQEGALPRLAGNGAIVSCAPLRAAVARLTDERDPYALDRERVPTLLAGAVMLEELIDLLELHEAEVTSCGLIDGLARRLGEESPW